MTCIVGMVKAGKVYIGGDSAGIAGLQLSHRQDQKVFKNGNFLFGFTDSFRMGQVLRYSFSPPERKVNQDLMAFMVHDFVNAVRDCLKCAGFARMDNCVESGGFFLVGHEGRLFTIQADYQVAEEYDDYTAIGCGAEIALGSMFATKNEAGPKERIEIALKAATRHSAGVEGPYVIEEL